MADKNSLTIRVGLVGDEKVVAALKNLGAAGEAALKKLQSGSDALGAKGGFLGTLSRTMASARTSFVALGSGIHGVVKAEENFSKSIDHMIKRTTILTAAVTGAVVGFAELARSAAENAHDIVEQSSILGLSTKAYQHFSDIMEVTGGDASALGRILTKFDLGLIKSAAAAKKAQSGVHDFGENLRVIGQVGYDASKALTSVGDAAGVTVTRGLDAAAKAATGTGNALLDSITGTDPEKRLVEFAHKLAAIPTALGRLQALTQGELFDTRSARPALAFFAGLEEGLKHVLPELKETQLELGDRLSGALHAFDINIRRLKDGIIDTFAAPVLIEALNNFGDFLIRNQTRINEFAKSVVLGLIPVIEDLFNTLTGNDAAVKDDRFIKFRDTVIDLGRTAKSVFFDILVPAFKAVREAAEAVAGVINSVFGTKFSGDALLIVGGLLAITGGFKALTSGVGLLIAALKLANSGFLGLRVAAIAALVGLDIDFARRAKAMSELSPDKFKATLQENESPPLAGPNALNDSANAISDAFGGRGPIVEAFKKLPGLIAPFIDKIKKELAGLPEEADKQSAGMFDRLGKSLTDFGAIVSKAFDKIKPGIVAAFEDAIAAVKSALRGLVSFVEDLAGEIRDMISNILAQIRSGTNAASQLGARAGNAGASSGGGSIGNGGGAGGFAGGGFIRGPGSETSDSILARLSRGEFVMRAAAVRKYGLAAMAALNSLRLPPGGLAGFALGGLAGAMTRGLGVPRYALGGLAGVGPSAPGLTHSLTLNIGGETFAGLLAPEDVAARLISFASRRGAVSMGQKPSWYGR